MTGEGIVDVGSDQLSRGRISGKLAKKWSRGPRNPEIWPPGGVKIDPPKSGPSPRNPARKPRNSGSQDHFSRNRPKSYYDRYPGLSPKTTEYNLSHPHRICANWAPRARNLARSGPPGPEFPGTGTPPRPDGPNLGFPDQDQEKVAKFLGFGGSEMTILTGRKRYLN